MQRKAVNLDIDLLFDHYFVPLSNYGKYHLKCQLCLKRCHGNTAAPRAYKWAHAPRASRYSSSFANASGILRRPIPNRT